MFTLDSGNNYVAIGLNDQKMMNYASVNYCYYKVSEKTLYFVPMFWLEMNYFIINRLTQASRTFCLPTTTVLSAP